MKPILTNKREIILKKYCYFLLNNNSKILMSILLTLNTTYHKYV
nr:MAG TPA: hypothetical protein [Bacteriophage sp.]